MADEFQSTNGSLDRDSMTLAQHVLQEVGSLGDDAQDISALMNRVAFAGKLVSRRLTRAGLVEDAMGFTGKKNVQGESVKKMDEYANDVFISVFQRSGLVCRLVSEEMEDIYHIPENCPIGGYTLLYDPIDGSSNVDINLNVGSIFSVRRRQDGQIDRHRFRFAHARTRPNSGGLHSVWAKYGFCVLHWQGRSCLYARP